MTKPLSLGMDVNEYYLNHVIELSEPQTMWDRIDHRVRAAVTKAGKRGLVVKTDNSAKVLEVFYNLNLRTKTRLGVSARPLKFFKAISKHMSGHFGLYLAEVEGKVMSQAALPFATTECSLLGTRLQTATIYDTIQTMS